MTKSIMTKSIRVRFAMFMILTIAIIFAVSLNPSYSVYASSVSVDQGSFTYSGSWSTQTTGTAVIGTTTTYSNTTNNNAYYTFTGTGVTLYATQDNQRGIANVYLDGTFVYAFDGYANTTQRVSVIAYSVSNLAYGSHTITVYVAGTKNPSSAGYYVELDGLYYDNGNTATPTPTSAGSGLTFMGGAVQVQGGPADLGGSYINCSISSGTTFGYFYCFTNLNGNDPNNVLAGKIFAGVTIRNNDATNDKNYYVRTTIYSLVNGGSYCTPTCDGVAVVTHGGLYNNYEWGVNTTSTYQGQFGGSALIEFSTDPSVFANTPTPTITATQNVVVIVTNTPQPTYTGLPTSTGIPTATALVIATGGVTPTSTPFVLAPGTAPATITAISTNDVPLVLVPTRDFSCPVTTPIGYGLVTPNANWQILCGQCMGDIIGTATTYPTYDFSGVSTSTSIPPTTAAGTPTYTPVPSITPTASLDIMCGGSNWGLSCEQVSSRTIRLLPQYGGNTWHDFYVFTSGTLYSSWFINTPMQWYSYNWGSPSMIYGLSPYIVADGSGKNGTFSAGVYQDNVTASPTMFEYQLKQSASIGQAGLHVDTPSTYVLISLDPISAVVTPTALPSGSSYCDVVDNSAPLVSDFDLFSYDPPACVSTPEISARGWLPHLYQLLLINLPSDYLVWMEWGIPASTICYQGISIADVNLYGVSVPFGLIGAIIIIY